MSRKINKARFFAQSRTKNLKYLAPLATGTVLEVMEVIAGTIPREDQPDLENDSILCRNSDGEMIKISVKDYANMEVVGDGKAYSSEDDSEDLLLPESITIAGSSDREFEGKPLYPLFAYEGAQEWLKLAQDERDFSKLVANGPMEGNTYSPTQDYKISVN